jgi:hypothetical protein
MSYVSSARLEGRIPITIAGRSSVCYQCHQSKEDEDVGLLVAVVRDLGLPSIALDFGV